MTKVKQILKTRTGNALLGILGLIGVWLMFLRATETGSLQQYGILIVLLILGINRIAKAIRGK